jgi:hypothetical protein
MKNKCIIILSSKSAGSTACQKVLTKYAQAKHIKYTRHNEQETLFWTKAASILGLRQEDMPESEIPLTADFAKSDLQIFINNNLNTHIQLNTKEDIFKAWDMLCKEFGPIFIEKSPHHLFQKSAIQLIQECIIQSKNVDYLLVGLVRNPMDVIYSQYKRWGFDPNLCEYTWIQTYNNLLSLMSRLTNNLVILKYEDMVFKSESIARIFYFCEKNVQDVDPTFFYTKSIQKWRNDTKWKFKLSDESIDIAKQFGYSYKELIK